jgi:hypothetical protein
MYMGDNLFPRTEVGGLSLSRMVIGTNNIMGGSHRTYARDVHIQGINNNAEAVADIIEAYMQYGVDTIIGCLSKSRFALDGIKLAQERTGKRVYFIELAVFDMHDNKEARQAANDYFKNCKAVGVDICMPLHNCVEELVNKQKRTIDRIGDYMSMIREHGMIPGLSAHMPEIIEYTDENGYDVETYIQIYNAAGFLMQIEVETVHKMIWKAKKPVLTIKPMAAGHLNPFVGLTFSWATLRPRDMVAVGCMTPEEAHEAVEYSLAALERRPPDLKGRKHQY